MRYFWLVILALGLFGQAGCAEVRTYSGPEVTRVVVMKSDRKLYLLNEKTVLKSYDIDLGFAPVGAKSRQGDGRTPEGRYWIDRKNPNSAFYLSVGISYPNAEDRRRARAAGVEPGGDIFVHGARRPGDKRGPDWTAGCISVSNREIEEIYAMVKIGTIIDIFP